jgi:aspartate/methionine/tyrosine aminotransferase
MKKENRTHLLENENAFEVLSRAQKLEEKGKKIINLGIGQPDFSPPSHVIEAGIKALRDAPHGYSNARGILELREAISSENYNLFKKNLSPEHILISPGGKSIIFIAISMLAGFGSEIILPNPSFPIYKSIINYCGSKPIFFPLKEENNFNLNADDILSKVNTKTKLIILNSPCNPTGSVIERKEINKLLQNLENFPNIYIFSDEIYSKIIFNNNKISSLLEYEQLAKKLIILNGLSKSFSMTGWRIGWGIFPKHLIELAEKFATNLYSCVNNFTQYAAVSAITGPQNSVAVMRKSYEKRAKMMVTGINEVNGFNCKFPNGAFYCFPNISGTGLDADKLQKILLNKIGIATISGNSFGPKNNDYIRISCCTSEDNILDAISILKNYFNN